MNAEEKELSSLEKKRKLIAAELEALKEETREATSDEGLGITTSARDRYNLLRIEFLNEELVPLDELIKAKRDHLNWVRRVQAAERTPHK